MAIDWSQLKSPQQLGGVIGNIAPQQRGLDSLSGGVMGGAAQGANIAQSMQAIAASKQKMAQDAALFPLEQRNAAAIANTNEAKAGQEGIALTQAQRKEQDILTLRAKAKEGQKQFESAYQTINPVEYQSYLTNKYQAEEAKQKAVKALSDNKKDAPAILSSLNLAGGSLAAAAGKAEADSIAAGKTPQEAQQVAQAVYTQQLLRLPEDIRSSYIPVWNKGTQHDLLNNAHLAQIELLQQQKLTAKDTISDTEKKVEYVTQLKQMAESLPEGSPEKKAAKEKLDLALGQLKQDEGLWSQIKHKFADVVGGAVGNIVNRATRPGGVVSPQYSPADIAAAQAVLDARGKK